MLCRQHSCCPVFASRRASTLRRPASSSYLERGGGRHSDKATTTAICRAALSPHCADTSTNIGPPDPPPNPCNNSHFRPMPTSCRRCEQSECSTEPPFVWRHHAIRVIFHCDLSFPPTSGPASALASLRRFSTSPALFRPPPRTRTVPMNVTTTLTGTIIIAVGTNSA